MKDQLIIIGGGHAGGMAAVLLIQKKFSGNIMIIGDENFLPYQRPALSKSFLSGATQKESLYIKNQEFYKKNDIEVLLGTSVVSIDRKSKRVILENGESKIYSKLIIATGSKLKEIQSQEEENSISYLRTIDDSEKLKNAIQSKNSIAIIGSGYIGLEIAATASKFKLNIHVVEFENRVMSRSASSQISSFFESKHNKAGVNFKFGRAVLNIKNGDTNKTLFLSDGSTVKAEIVAAGIGVEPNISLAQESGLECDNGITVDQNCLTSDENIFAIGDCTNHKNDIYGYKMRLESVHNAVEQAKIAVNYILGSPTPYCQVPWFWSDQYDIKLQIAGICQSHDTQIINGSLEDEKFSVLSLKNNKLIAVESINKPRDFMIGKKLIEQQTRISKKQLKEKNLDLKNLL